VDERLGQKDIPVMRDMDARKVTKMGPVYESRAIRSLSVRIENDPEPMVHQQLARLKFFEHEAGSSGLRILEFGCGSGLNCHWLKHVGGAHEVTGFDSLADAVDLSKHSFPNIEFRVADGCDPTLEIQPGTWDRIVCFEVLEHVPDVATLLGNIHRHLAPDGIAFISTPNRPVFSLNHHPSPVNREHINEYSLEELRPFLSAWFGSLEIYGQRFKRKSLLEAWHADVGQKIERLKAGTRWQPKTRPSEELRKIGLVERAYQLPLLRAAWKRLRWGLIEGVSSHIATAWRPYAFRDFEFVSDDLSDCLWFCAVLRR
jgi:SAM-dependent methyltransferase